MTSFPSKKAMQNALRVTIFGLIEIEGQGIAAIVGGVLIVLVVLGAIAFKY